MFGRMGPWEIGLILVIILIVFGVGRLPQVSASIGKGLRSFRKASRGEDEDEEEEKKPVAKKSVTKKVSKESAS